VVEASSPSLLSADGNASETPPTASATVTRWSSDESKKDTVSLRTYAAYISAAGGIVALLAVLFVSVVAEGTKGFSVWWLAYWLEQGSGSTNVSLLDINYSLLLLVRNVIYAITIMCPSLFAARCYAERGHATVSCLSVCLSVSL